MRSRVSDRHQRLPDPAPVIHGLAKHTALRFGARLWVLTRGVGLSGTYRFATMKVVMPGKLHAIATPVGVGLPELN